MRRQINIDDMQSSYLKRLQKFLFGERIVDLRTIDGPALPLGIRESVMLLSRLPIAQNSIRRELGG